MGRNLERLVQKARTERPPPPELPDNALPIFAECGSVQAQVGRLIAAGKLMEADRARCFNWQRFFRGDAPLNPEQLAFVRLQAAIAREKVPDVGAAYVFSMASILECLNPMDENAISECL
ncbi:MAG TPA: hypothetical protein VLX44_15960 [Xanthobacteraceae bacterium]|nr:hypothetical protein [Xanthobacteraceae bacterium]